MQFLDATNNSMGFFPLNVMVFFPVNGMLNLTTVMEGKEISTP